MVIEITFVSGATFNAISSTYTTCNIESGVIGYDQMNPVSCTLDAANSKIVIYNVFSFTTASLKIYYYARMACSQSNFDVMVKAYANPQAYNERNWILFGDQTSNYWTLNTMWYSDYASWGGAQSTSENPYNAMQPTCSDGYSTCTNVFASGIRMEGGYSQVIGVSSTQIVVRVYMTGNYDFYSSTYRMGFRFYAERLTVGSCSSVSLWSSRYGSNGWCQQGSCSYTCGTGDRMFYVAFYLYRAQSTQSQWPYWYSGDYYDITFNFNSVGQDTNNYANSIFVQGTLVWENSLYYYNDQGHCGCCSTCCCNTCYGSCCSGCTQCCFYYDSCCSTYSCNPYCCCTYCCAGCNCRWMYAWSYTALVNNAAGWAQPSTAIASSASASLMSNQYGVETEFSFYLQNLNAKFTSSLTTSTPGNNAQLVVSFTGNNVFPNTNNPFGYTTTSETAAPIECLCVSSGSGISINSGTSYTAANCTRYAISGFPAFLTVRINANAGGYLACYFPGFNTPTSSGNGGTMYVNFYSDPMGHFKLNPLPEQFRSVYQTVNVAIGLTTQGSNPNGGFNTVTYNNTFWQTYGTVNQNKFYQLYLQGPYSVGNPYIYISSYSPKFQQSTCNSGSYYVCRAYNSFYSRRYFLVAQYAGSTYYLNITDNLNFPQSQEASSSYYTTYIGWTSGGYGYYYYLWSGSLNTGYLSPATPSVGLTPATYSTNLQYAKSLMSVSAALSGYTLYSNYRTQGPFYGSKIVLTLSGFSTLYGCGVYVDNVPTPVWTNNALYCIIQSSTQINVYSNSDWTFTGNMYITFYTDNVPSSSTYTFQLYDKYYSGSNYGLAISNAGSFSRTVSGSYVTLPATSVRWRRQAFKSPRSDAGPVKLILNNNYQYVSTYDMSADAESSSSDGILVYVPGSGLSNSPYYCYLREYPANQYSYYKEYVTNCAYYSTTQVLIKSIPSHILSPNYYY